jgi:AraC-like DNA-binding protein
VLAAIDARLADRAVGALDAASLSAVAGLSVGRLGHAFRSQVGLPVRPYVKWRRLERAAHALGEGRSMAAAAHEAGFADGAHFSRTFRAMTGLSPSTLVGHVAWITRAR